MKKQVLCISVILLVSLLFGNACTSALFVDSRVLKSDNDTAIVEGIGVSKAEARLNAEKAAIKLFSEYTETKEAEYSNVDQGSTKFMNTKVICTMYIKRK